MNYTQTALSWAREIASLKEALEIAQARRDECIVGMNKYDKIPKSRISDKLRSGLALGDGYFPGLTEDQIEGLGVSEWSVRRVFDKAREKVDNSVNV